MLESLALSTNQASQHFNAILLFELLILWPLYFSTAQRRPQLLYCTTHKIRPPQNTPPCQCLGLANASLEKAITFHYALVIIIHWNKVLMCHLRGPKDKSDKVSNRWLSKLKVQLLLVRV